MAPGASGRVHGHHAPRTAPWRHQEEQRAQGPRFPKYDDKAEKSDEPAICVISTQPHSGRDSLVQDLQAGINLARKVETRVHKLDDEKNRRCAQWAQFQEDMPRSYQQEKMRHHQALLRLDGEIRDATTQQAEARERLRAP